ncbi:unnamed protein product, partial [marine sediment metagenome]
MVIKSVSSEDLYEKQRLEFQHGVKKVEKALIEVLKESVQTITHVEYLVELRDYINTV